MKNIYFMRRADGIGPIKIGCSTWPAERLKMMQVWAPHLLEVAMMVPGGFAEEKRLHNQFAEHRLHGEWFEPAAPLLALIARCNATGELPPPSPDDRIVRIVAMYKGGATMQAIADEFDVSRQRIEQILRKSGVKLRGRVVGAHRKVPSWTRLEELRSLAASGLSAGQIAAGIGDLYANVIRVARMSGIPITRTKRGQSSEAAARAFAVAADYKAGMNSKVIMEKHSLNHKTTIYRHLKISGAKVTRRAATAETYLPIETILSAYGDGQTLKAIAGRYSVKATAVRRIVNAHGKLRGREENEAIRKAAVAKANRRRGVPTADREQAA